MSKLVFTLELLNVVEVFYQHPFREILWVKSRKVDGMVEINAN